jgi:hypothetical protein
MNPKGSLPYSSITKKMQRYEWYLLL